MPVSRSAEKNSSRTKVSKTEILTPEPRLNMDENDEALARHRKVLADRYYDVVENWKMRIGKHDLLKHLKGESINRTAAMLAKCYDCNCGYDEETGDCEVYTCPLHPFMPFNKNKRKSREVSDEQREVMRQRMQKRNAQSS